MRDMQLIVSSVCLTAELLILHYNGTGVDVATGPVNHFSIFVLSPANRPFPSTSKSGIVD